MQRLFARPLWLFVLILGPVWATAQPAERTLERPWLEGFLTELSHDSLQGRATFTPGIERAARLIEREYRRAGLDSVAGLAGGVQIFRQHYRVFRTRPAQVAGSFNGSPLQPNQVVGTGPAAPTKVTTAGGATVSTQRVARGQNLFALWRSLTQSPTPVVLLVDTSLATDFARLRTARGRMSQTPQLPPAPVVAILTAEDKLQSLDLQVSGGLDTLVASNVLGYLRGRSRPDEWVVFSAHYDHIGIIRPVNGDSIANGADDDGSGTTAVVALAHHFARAAQQGQGPERSVLFTCFSGEEMGLLGSQHFAGTLVRPEQVVAGFNLEMLGKPSGRGPATAWISGWDKSNFGLLLNQALSTSTTADSTFFPDPYPTQNIWQRSDHYSLARRGIPAHIIMSDAFLGPDGRVEPYYHTVDDEIGTLNLDHFAGIVQKIARAAGPILAGRATPTRIQQP